MEKELALQCVPVELMERLKTLAAKFWEERNPASVSLNSILEEYEPEVKTLGHLIKEYETEYSERLASSQSGYAQKESRLKKEIEALKARLVGIEASMADTLKHSEELKSAFNARETLLTELKIKTAENEGAFNAKYADRMRELYGKVNKKELEMLARWEEKNRELEAKTQELESGYAVKGKQLKLREKALEDDFNARKIELIKTFDRIKSDIDAREQTLESDYAAKNQQLRLREKALEEDFNTRKTELIKNFDRIKAALDARDSALAAKERGGAV